MNICFDFDGPIIDVSDRYYRAYIESLKGIDVDQILEKEVFWELKRQRVTEFEIGIMTGLTTKEAKASADKRRILTFKTDFHQFDKVFDDAVKTFEFLKSKNIPYFLVTLRRRRHLLLALKMFKLAKYLPEGRIFCLDDNQEFKGDIHEKYKLLFDAINNLGLNPMQTIMIGDSETDIHSAHMAKLGKTIGIDRGIRSREQLAGLNPDGVISNLREAVELISSQSQLAH